MEPGPAGAPYATLLTFSRFVGRTGPAKATFVGTLRRARQSRSGFNPHAQFVKALKSDIQFRARGRSSAVAAVVDAVQPRWRPLYQALWEGAERYLETLGDPSAIRLVPVREAIDVVGGLTVKVNPHFGLRYGDGRLEAVRLHFDPEPPAPDLVLATLQLMTRQMQTILPKATPALVDLRRGAAHRPDPRTRREDVELWLAGEALGFAAMWSAARPATPAEPAAAGAAVHDRDRQGMTQSPDAMGDAVATAAGRPRPPGDGGLRARRAGAGPGRRDGAGPVAVGSVALGHPGP